MEMKINIFFTYIQYQVYLSGGYHVHLLSGAFATRCIWCIWYQVYFSGGCNSSRPYMKYIQVSELDPLHWILQEDDTSTQMVSLLVYLVNTVSDSTYCNLQPVRVCKIQMTTSATFVKRIKSHCTNSKSFMHR